MLPSKKSSDWTLYNYCQNNPIGRSDKSGLLDDIVIKGAKNYN